MPRDQHLQVQEPVRPNVGHEPARTCGQTCPAPTREPAQVQAARLLLAQVVAHRGEPAASPGGRRPTTCAASCSSTRCSRRGELPAATRNDVLQRPRDAVRQLSLRAPTVNPALGARRTELAHLSSRSVTADLFRGRAMRLRLLGTRLHAAVGRVRSSALDPPDDVVAAAGGVRSRSVVVRLRFGLTLGAFPRCRWRPAATKLQPRKDHQKEQQQHGDHQRHSSYRPRTHGALHLSLLSRTGLATDLYPRTCWPRHPSG